MLLAIDVSNTNTKLGLFEGERLTASFRIRTDRARTADELGVLALGLFAHAGLRAESVCDVIIASVVPPLSWVLGDFVDRYFHLRPLFVEATMDTGMPVVFPNPSELGADRIVNGVAARHLFGAPVVVVDFGTATTFDVISAAGAYLGGVIAPGMLISAEALFTRAARLPPVAVERPERVIGRSTGECMQAGLFLGYVGLVEGLLERIASELGQRPQVVATGGLAERIAGETRQIHHVEPALTLLGLRLIHERQRRL